MKCMSRTTDAFEELKFWLAQNQPFEAKTFAAAGRASKIELLFLVLNVMVISRLKSTQCHFYGIHGMS